MPGHLARRFQHIAVAVDGAFAQSIDEEMNSAEPQSSSDAELVRMSDISLGALP